MKSEQVAALMFMVWLGVIFAGIADLMSPGWGRRAVIALAVMFASPAVYHLGMLAVFGP